MRTLLALLLLTLAPAPVQGQDGSGDVDLRLLGGVEAAEGPVGRSRARFRRPARGIAPRGDRSGDLGRISAPISSLVRVRGQEDNAIMGIGLVDGLAGSGDSGALSRQLLRNMLLTRNINIDERELSSQNIAVVRVEAELPAGADPGTRIDVRVSTIGDATSLVGGNLMLTELADMRGGEVYATASGPLTVGGFSAEGGAATATKNHVTVGLLPAGGKVEREVPTRIVSEHGYLYLDMKSGQDSFANVVEITGAVNGLYPGAATSLADGKTVRVEVPFDLPESTHVAFVDSLLSREVVTANLARVVINERTGVIVMGGDVRLRPGAIAHGSLVVTIAETPQASQPSPLSGGTTERLERTSLDVDEEVGGLVLIPGAVTLQEVVDVLNVLGATPRDMISILTAMSDGGLLVADIRRI